MAAPPSPQFYILTFEASMWLSKDKSFLELILVHCGGLLVSHELKVIIQEIWKVYLFMFLCVWWQCWCGGTVVRMGLSSPLNTRTHHQQDCTQLLSSERTALVVRSHSLILSGETFSAQYSVTPCTQQPVLIYFHQLLCDISLILCSVSAVKSD